jgi:hypothetical protein
MTLEPGSHLMVLVCPRCGEQATTLVHLAARLTVDDDGATLKATAKSKPVDHACGTTALFPVPTDPTSPDEVGTRPLDYRERQTGERNDPT